MNTNARAPIAYYTDLGSSKFLSECRILFISVVCLLVFEFDHLEWLGTLMVYEHIKHFKRGGCSLLLYFR